MGLVFQITQHSKDFEFMQNFINFWGCGRISKRSDGVVVDFIVTKFSDLTEKVLPFFERMPLHGLKQKNLADFCKVASIMKAKGHLTPEGLDEIKLIKGGMNTKRIDF